jgi:Sulfotransferase family
MPEAADARSVDAASADSAPIRVIGVLGTSFSGSTVLNLLLGAHPRIYAGGEMIGLVLNRDKPGSGSCTSCGLDCRYWSAAARASVNKNNVYQIADRAFGRQLIVDTSKSAEWFKETVGSSGQVEIASYVLLVKHPIRYLASCVVNMGDCRPRDLRRRWLGRMTPGGTRGALIDQLAQDLTAYYRNFFASYTQMIGGCTFHLLHYERLVADPPRALAPLLKSVGLSYDAGMDDFYSADHHQIGGNNGAVYQINRSWQGAEAEIPAFRRAFYEDYRGLRIDEKYRQVFSARELSRLRASPAITELADQLGYDDPAMPFPIQR